MPEILTSHQLGYVEAAINKLEALRDGTLSAGDGGTVSFRQKTTHLRHVIDCVETVLQDVERNEEEGPPVSP